MKVKRQRVWFEGSRSNLNGSLAKRCTLEKDVTSRLLRSKGINAPENMVFSADQLVPALAWAEHVGAVVVKPPSGGLGELVHIKPSFPEEFEAAFRAVADAYDNVLVERFHEGTEHRVLVIYGRVAAAARRIPANVIGNGEDTVKRLISVKNRERRNAQNPAHYEIPIDGNTRKTLSNQQLTLAAIPAEGQQVWLRSNSNVHSGGDGLDATDELTPEEVALAERAARAFPGLKLAGLDLLLPRDGVDCEPCVLEINASPMITGHHYPWTGEGRDVAGMLLDAMYPNTAATKPADGFADQNDPVADKPKQRSAPIRFAASMKTRFKR